MPQHLGLVSVVVADYDESIDFFVNRLGFSLVEDTPIPEQSKRWVVVSPPGSTESRLLLAKASSPEQLTRVGNQTGGRVFLFLNTDNFARDFERVTNEKPDIAPAAWQPPEAIGAIEVPKGPNVDLSAIDSLAPRYKEWDEKAREFQTAETPKADTPAAADTSAAADSAGSATE